MKMRTCDADAMIKDRYGNQLQITHEAEVKVSLRPALMTGTLADVLTSCLVWPHTELILATEAHKDQNSTGNPQAPTLQPVSCQNL